MTDERTLRQLLEDTQARLKQADAKVEDLERRHRLADMRAQTDATRAQKLEQEMASLRKQLASAQEANLGDQVTRLVGQQAALQQRLDQLDQEIPPDAQRPDVCSRCGGTQMLTSSDFRGSDGGLLCLMMARNHDAIFMPDMARFDLLTSACGTCGLIEVFAKEPQWLYRVCLEVAAKKQKANQQT